MNKILKLMDRIEEYILSLSLGIMVIVVFLATVFRFTKIATIVWSEELSRYLMITIVFIGIARGARDNKHYTVDNFVNMLPKSLQKIMFIVRTAVICWFSSVIIIQSFYFITGVKRMGQLSPALRIPMWLPYTVIPVGFILVVIRSVEYLVSVHVNKDNMDTESVNIDRRIK